MWDRSYRWQRHVRLAAGGLVILALLVAAGILSGTSAAARTRAGAGDLAREVFSPTDQIIRVEVPASLLARVGTLVYRQREDGVAQVIGRVTAVAAAPSEQVALTIRLSAPSMSLARQGGLIQGAPAALNMRDAVRLLVSPNTPDEEALLARDAIWPSVRENLVPEIMNGLVQEISQDLADPNAEDAELLKRFAASLHESLAPLEEQLVQRLAGKAWEVVGVQGLAGGAIRATTGNAASLAGSIAAWWSWFQGEEEDANAPPRPFLSAKMSADLKTALEAEVIKFWQENREQIVAAFKKSVDAQRGDFEQAFTDRWSGRLYDRVIEPAWQAHQDQVLASVETYVRSFTERRLLTKEGGPRLKFAFLLRSYLDISTSPLLVVVPAEGHSRQFVYQSFLQ
jgi:hypothetical protein